MKTDKRIIRYIEKHGALPVGADKFTLISVRGTFKRGIIKLNTARDAYILTRYGLTLCEKPKAPVPTNVVICSSCFYAGLKYSHKCIKCGKTTPYGRLIQRRKEAFNANSASIKREGSRLS